MQVLDSNEDIEVKIKCFDYLYQVFTADMCLDSNMLKIITECKSFAELMLKMTIFNSDVSQYVVLYLMLFKPKWIKEWIDYDKEGMNLMLNISDLFEELYRRGHK